MKKILNLILMFSFVSTMAVPPVFALDVNVLPEQNMDLSNTNATITVPENTYDMNISITGGIGAVGTLNWNSFNVGENASVNFEFTDNYQTALNKVSASGGMSEIYGSITNSGIGKDTGKVFLINPNGILFGETANVNLNSFTASTLDVNKNNDIWEFTKGETFGDIELKNGAVINADKGVALVGKNITAYKGSAISTTNNYGAVKLITADGVNFTYADDGYIQNYVIPATVNSADSMVITLSGGINSNLIHAYNNSNNADSQIDIKGGVLKATKAVEDADGNIELISENDILNSYYDDSSYLYLPQLKADNNILFQSKNDIKLVKRDQNKRNTLAQEYKLEAGNDIQIIADNDINFDTMWIEYGYNSTTDTIEVIAFQNTTAGNNIYFTAKNDIFFGGGANNLKANNDIQFMGGNTIYVGANQLEAKKLILKGDKVNNKYVGVELGGNNIIENDIKISENISSITTVHSRKLSAGGTIELLVDDSQTGEVNVSNIEAGALDIKGTSFSVQPISNIIAEDYINITADEAIELDRIKIQANNGDISITSNNGSIKLDGSKIETVNSGNINLKADNYSTSLYEDDIPGNLSLPSHEFFPNPHEYTIELTGSKIASAGDVNLSAEDGVISILGNYNLQYEEADFPVINSGKNISLISYAIKIDESLIVAQDSFFTGSTNHTVISDSIISAMNGNVENNCAKSFYFHNSELNAKNGLTMNNTYTGEIAIKGLDFLNSKIKTDGDITMTSKYSDIVLDGTIVDDYSELADKTIGDLSISSNGPVSITNNSIIDAKSMDLYSIYGSSGNVSINSSTLNLTDGNFEVNTMYTTISDSTVNNESGDFIVKSYESNIINSTISAQNDISVEPSIVTSATYGVKIQDSNLTAVDGEINIDTRDIEFINNNSLNSNKNTLIANYGNITTTDGTLNLNNQKTKLTASDSINVSLAGVSNKNNGLYAKAGQDLTVKADTLAISDLIQESSNGTLTIEASELLAGISETNRNALDWYDWNKSDSYTAYIEVNGNASDKNPVGFNSTPSYKTVDSYNLSGDGKYNQYHNVVYGADEKVFLNWDVAKTSLTTPEPDQNPIPTPDIDIIPIQPTTPEPPQKIQTISNEQDPASLLGKLPRQPEVFDGDIDIIDNRSDIYDVFEEALSQIKVDEKELK